jgi:hypothetical protein
MSDWRKLRNTQIIIPSERQISNYEITENTMGWACNTHENKSRA